MTYQANLSPCSTNEMYSYRTLVPATKSKLEQILNRVKCLILINKLKETLICPYNLLIASDVNAKREKIEEDAFKSASMTRRPAKKIASSKFSPFDRSTLSSSLTNKPDNSKKDSEPEKSKGEEFSIPLIDKKFFPINERFKKGEGFTALINNPVFKNFKVLNTENAYLSLLDTDIYILALNEIENKYAFSGTGKSSISIPENSGTNELLTFEEIKNNEEILCSKNVLVLRVFSMEEYNDNAIKKFVDQINEILFLVAICI